MDGSLVESILQRIVTGALVGSIYGLLCTGLGMMRQASQVVDSYKVPQAQPVS